MSFSTFKDDAGSRARIGQLIYRSVSTGSARGAIEIADILYEARSNNPRMDITGVLAVVDNTFVQVLEGPDEALDRLMTALDADTRHTGMRVMQRRHVEQRTFGDWAMVSPRLSPTSTASLGRLLVANDDRLDSYVPILTSALEAQDRLADHWGGPDRSGESA
ncbi:hypothetical protein BZG35_15005 [Brevundimonas sp. LM2]|uniref:BLUF domain-containing protein n=1 Tax=Brevundimonas sp. LM2 TaxID=1938605 RepID=UPI000983F3AE|nr:BLUF domain-containing protein [Brevundimonas sp. LM2]AQR62815.1 hypothetical protein BZG35_15005 [Brevundimonas sp. LM2]